MTSNDVLEAVRRLLDEPQFQDVHFRCSDGRTVSSNRAFLAARCEYFERLLFGDLKESSCSEIGLHASSEAVRHVLVHLHTGGFTSIEQEACWITLMEASSLAQQYILPGMVQHVADRLSADLRPENLGLALSHALKADLQAVIKSIWIALPRLLQRPFALDRSFSADAICFCLQHTAWMTHPATPQPNAANSSSAATAANGQLTTEPSGGAINRASSINGASIGSGSLTPQGADGAAAAAAAASRALYAPGSRADSAAAQEAQAFSAVLHWMLQEVAGCAECEATRHITSKHSGDKGVGSCPSTPRGAGTNAAPITQLVPAGQVASSATTCTHQLQEPPSAAGSSRAGAAAAAAVDRCSSLSPPVQEITQPQHPAMQGSQQRLQQQHSATQRAPSGGLAGRLSSHSVRSSYESDTTEGEHDIRSMRGVGSAASAASGPVAEAAGTGSVGGRVNFGVSAFALSSAQSSFITAAFPPATAEQTGLPGASGAAAAAVTPQGAPPAAAPPPVAVPSAATADTSSDQQQQQQEQELVYSGSCCVGHQGMLLQMLAHLNWHLLEPRLLQQLESLALLGPAALLEIYRAHQRCCHLAQWGNFPSLSLGAERGLRGYVSGGEQVLECESVSHLTATSNLCFTRGKHCWQFVVAVPCDLVWLGLSDGSLAPDVWGGKQPGGWFYGSNDALCHNKQSDRHAYTKHCGNGKWGDGAVIDVCLDMDAREVWFGVDGAEPKLGFSGLPDKVYPAVSLRAPAQLLVRFRAASWLMSE